MPRRTLFLTLGALLAAAVSVFGARGSFGLFIKPWEDAYGAGRGAASLVSAVGFVALGLGQPIAGRMLDRWGGRKVLLFGLVLVTAGLAGAAMSPSLWLAIVCAGGIASFGAGFASLSTLTYTAADLVQERRGAVFGILTAAAAGGQVVVLPIATAVLGVSLRASLLTLAAITGVALVFAWVVVRDHAPATGSTSAVGGALGMLARTPGFWLLLVPFAVCGYTSTGLTDTHLIPYATDHHISEAAASAALATLAAFNVAGVLVAGFLTDKVDRGRLLTWIYLMRAATLFALPSITTPGSLFLFAGLFGIADFASVPPTTSLARDVCRTGGWGFALGLIGAAHQGGAALGAWFGGFAYERLGSYDAMFVSAAVALLGAAGLSYALRERSPVTDITAST